MPSRLSRTISRFFPLPPPETRRSGPIPATWFLVAYRPERDADYLLGRLFHLVFFAALLLVAAILLDVYLATGLLLDAGAFQDNKLLLPATFSRLIGIPAFLIGILFYLRIRMTSNIHKDDIPVGGGKEWTLAIPRRRWITVGIGSALGSLICIFASHILVIRITLHYEQQDNLTFILFTLVVGIYMVAFGPVLFCLGALIFEKAFRCFDALQENLKRNYEYALNKQ